MDFYGIKVRETADRFVLEDVSWGGVPVDTSINLNGPDSDEDDRDSDNAPSSVIDSVSDISSQESEGDYDEGEHCGR